VAVFSAGTAAPCLYVDLKQAFKTVLNHQLMEEKPKLFFPQHLQLCACHNVNDWNILSEVKLKSENIVVSPTTSAESCKAYCLIK